jgi:hypothetical protein
MRIATENHRSRTLPRRGIIIVELLLVAPVFLVLLTAMIEFCLILVARQELLAACQHGCRVASHGAPNQEVRAAIANALGDGRLAEAEVRVRHFEEDHVLPHAPRDRVQVVVHIPTTRVVPDFLGLIGISFAENELACGAVMSMEALVPHRRAHLNLKQDGGEGKNRQDR